MVTWIASLFIFVAVMTLRQLQLRIDRLALEAVDEEQVGSLCRIMGALQRLDAIQVGDEEGVLLETESEAEAAEQSGWTMSESEWDSEAQQDDDDGREQGKCGTDRFEEGVVLYGKHEFDLAFLRFEEAARRGHVESQSNCGAMYLTGTGVPYNASKAVYWYRRAANAFHPTALYNLGVCYEHGFGVPKNTALAQAWYSETVRLGIFMDNASLLLQAARQRLHALEACKDGP